MKTRVGMIAVIGRTRIRWNMVRLYPDPTKSCLTIPRMLVTLQASIFNGQLLTLNSGGLGDHEVYYWKGKSRKRVGSTAEDSDNPDQAKDVTVVEITDVQVQKTKRTRTLRRKCEH